MVPQKPPIVMNSDYFKENCLIWIRGTAEPFSSNSLELEVQSLVKGLSSLYVSTNLFS